MLPKGNLPKSNANTVCCCCAVIKLCLILCNLIDCSPPGSPVHGIFQARILEWAAISKSRGSPDPGIEPASPESPALAGDFQGCIESFCLSQLLPLCDWDFGKQTQRAKAIGLNSHSPEESSVTHKTTNRNNYCYYLLSFYYVTSTMTPWARSYYPHFSDEKTAVQTQ